jgi:polysaccharide pyruvyl transferase WcaK-like protein
MIHILQTGTYCSRNKGDAAMQLVHAREVPIAMPGASCIIGAPFPQLDQDFYAPVPCVRSSRRNLVLGTLWLLWLCVCGLVGVRLRRFPFDAEIDAMTRASAVVDLSGDMLTEDYGPHVGFSHFLPLLQALALRKPLFVLAQSIGPFRLLKPLARFILSRAAMVTVREEISYERMQALGIPAERLRLTADLAFLLPRAADERVESILREAGYSTDGRRLLGVSVSALLINRLHGSLQQAGEDPLGIIAGVLDRISERHDLDLLLVSHVTGPKPQADDRRIAEMLQQRLQRRAFVLEGDLRPEELKGAIARCHVFFGFRMHANIAALDSAVPVLAVGYSHKTRGIMRMFDMEDQVVPFSAIGDGTLEQRFDMLLDNHQRIREQLAERVGSVREAARENLRLIVAHLQPDATQLGDEGSK